LSIDGVPHNKGIATHRRGPGEAEAEARRCLGEASEGVEASSGIRPPKIGPEFLASDFSIRDALDGDGTLSRDAATLSPLGHGWRAHA
jgi:hypothetical protein